MWIRIIKTENKGIGIRLGIKKKELDQELELKKWNWTQVWWEVKKVNLHQGRIYQEAVEECSRRRLSGE